MVEEGDTIIEAPVVMAALWDEFVYQTQEAPAPSEPPDTVSVIETPEQIGVVRERVIPVGGEDAPGVLEQLRHCDPLQTPDVHLTAAGTVQEPLWQVDWSVKYPLAQDGPLPQAVPLALFLPGTHWADPVEQEIVPALWQELLGVQEAPWLQTVQLPPMHTDPEPQEVKSPTVVHVPVEHEWHWPHAV